LWVSRRGVVMFGNHFHLKSFCLLVLLQFEPHTFAIPNLLIHRHEFLCMAKIASCYKCTESWVRLSTLWLSSVQLCDVVSSLSAQCTFEHLKFCGGYAQLNLGIEIDWVLEVLILELALLVWLPDFKVRVVIALCPGFQG
jgi:hypothetical protein